MKFSEKFQDFLLLIAEKVDGNQYLQAIKNAFTSYMPFIIAGSFATLFNYIICSTNVGLARWIPWFTNLSPAFSAINYAAMNFMSIPITYLIARNLGRNDDVDEVVAGIIAIIAYVCVVPQALSFAVDGNVVGTAAGLGSTTTGAQGLFVGMFVAILAEKLLAKLLSINSLKIKMPASVPGAIAKSFNVLIPTIIVLVVFGVCGVLFRLATGSYLNEWIYKLIQTPLEKWVQSGSGIIVLAFLSQVFWVLGIHGGLVISPIRNPLLTSALAANTAAVAAGLTPNQPATMGFWMWFIVAGGAGLVFSLCLALLVLSKRDDRKMIAKLGLVPAFFGVSEPVVFGLPLVLNPTYAIPFVFNSAIGCAIALFFTSIGFLPCNTVDAPFGLPLILGAVIGHGWQGIVVELIVIAVGALVWTPFVLIDNAQAAKENKAAE